ncbi:MAG: hypothetical protein AABX40_05970, partial [Candidatus Hydrothermarchaeota archaeon]
MKKRGGPGDRQRPAQEDGGMETEAQLLEHYFLLQEEARGLRDSVTRLKKENDELKHAVALLSKSEEVGTETRAQLSEERCFLLRGEIDDMRASAFRLEKENDELKHAVAVLKARGEDGLATDARIKEELDWLKEWRSSMPLSRYEQTILEGLLDTTHGSGWPYDLEDLTFTIGLIQRLSSALLDELADYPHQDTPLPWYMLVESRSFINAPPAF